MRCQSSDGDGCLAWIILGIMCLFIWTGCDSAKKANDRIYELERQARQERELQARKIIELEARIQGLGKK